MARTSTTLSRRLVLGPLLLLVFALPILGLQGCHSHPHYYGHGHHPGHHVAHHVADASIEFAHFLVHVWVTLFVLHKLHHLARC